MSGLSRREVFALFGAAFPLAALACRGRALRPEERVCAHVYPETLALPAVLLEDLEPAPGRPARAGRFTTGLPELFVCTSAVPFLELFPYFWPVEPEELRRARDSIRVLFRTDELTSEDDATRLGRWLGGRPLPARSAGVFTYNGFTRFLARPVLHALRAAGASEVVVFKDPSLPPYLCDGPARQKRFRRPPP